MELSPGEEDYQHLLGLVYYMEEKYTLLPNQLPADSKDSFELSLLIGAALHNQDWKTFQSLVAKFGQIRGASNGWQSFLTGTSDEIDLEFESAAEQYRNCEADKDIVDPVCIVSAVRSDMRGGSYDAAKQDLENALKGYPHSRLVLSEAMFVNLSFGNSGVATQLHNELSSLPYDKDDEASDCLFYYGVDQPRSAPEDLKPPVTVYGPLCKPVQVIVAIAMGGSIKLIGKGLRSKTVTDSDWAG